MSISIPENLYLALAEIVKRKNSLYTSVSALAQEALREKIREEGA